MNHKYQLLCVDDEPIFLRIFNLLLQKDYDVDLATNGLEAIEKVKNKKYDLIITDIRMPEMDGIEATKIIKSIYPSIPIIGLSAFPEETIESVFDVYLQKPADKEVILIKIEYLLHKNEIS